jgi:hypothetical protein
MRSLAIKIDVPKTDQEAINKLLIECGYPPQKRKFHCTVGFIEKMIPDEETHSFGGQIVPLLQDFIRPLTPVYEVEKAVHIFKHVIAFIPTQRSLEQLHTINHWLHDKVKEISRGRFDLNQETQPETYTAHMSVWRTRKPDARFQKLEDIAQTHPTYSLTHASYVVF